MRLPTAWRPMVPWAVAAVLCAPLALSLLVFSRPVEPGAATPEMDKNVELLDHDFALPPKDAKVRRGVVFAISGLACAITGPRRLSGEPIDLTVLMKSAASLLDFRPLIDPTIAVRPDFVIVQSTMLVLAQKIVRPNAAKAARSFWRRQVLSLMPRLVPDDPARRKNTQELKRQALFSRCRARTKKPREQWRDYLVGVAARIMSPGDHRRDQVRAILLRFAEVGIPVLVVTPPFNKFSEAYYARVSAEVRSTVGPTAGAAEIFFLEPPKLWPNEQFIDALHIDSDQAGSYHAWLSAAIVAALGN